MSSDLRIAFLGTHHPAVPTLRVLAERGWVAVVVLPEDAGARNDGLHAIIREFGLAWSHRLGDIDAHRPNLLLAANYPKLVPARYLEAFPCINTHWSLLPRWRGVHGTAWALINGDEAIGLSVHRMAGEFDTGPILAQAAVRRTPDLTLESLHEKLARLQANEVLHVLDHYRVTGELPAIPQDEKDATYVPQRVPADGLIDWTWPTGRIAGLVTALHAPGYPGAFTHLEGRRLVIHRAVAADCPPYFCTPGQVVRVRSGGEVWIKTGDTCLEVSAVSWGDDTPVLPAREILKRGMKLGLNLEDEVARLRGEVDVLRSELAAMKTWMEVRA